MSNSKIYIITLVEIIWFMFFIWGISIFGEEIKAIVVKKGNLTIIGWLLVIISILTTWFVIWYKLKGNRCSPLASILIASAVALFIGSTIAITLAPDNILKISNEIGLGIFGLCLIMGLFGSLMLVLAIFYTIRIIIKYFLKQRLSRNK